MAELPFVDTHVHLWDLSQPQLRYSWLEPGVIHPILGDIEPLKVPLWGARELLDDTRAANVAKFVHVQAAVGIEDPVEETRWLEAQAAATGTPHAIVAHADLTSSELDALLERHLEASPRVRGIRDFGVGDYLTDPAWRRGFSRLQAHGFVCDLDCVWEDMGKARDVARSAPGVPLILDHAGFPRERTRAYFADWRRGLRVLAEAESVHCKISGLGMCDNDWTVASIRPWFEACLEAFGVERCVLGTNWPVDRLYSSYAAVIDTYAEIVAALSRDEQAALFSANAERLFRI